MVRSVVKRTFIAAVTAATCLVAVAPAASAALPNTPTPTWMVNGPVRAIAQVGDTIWIGGRFTELREKPVGQGGLVVPVSNVAAVSATTGQPVPGLNLPQFTGTGSIVYDFEVADGRLYVGGNYTAVDGVARRNLAAVDPLTGQMITTFKPAVGVVQALAASTTRLYLGGNFTSAAGKPRMRLAAVALTNGALDTVWRPSADARVRDLTMSPDGSLVYAAGHFKNVGGTDQALEPRDSIARFTADTGALDPWKLGCPCSLELFGVSVEPVGDRVYVGMGGSDWVAAASADTGEQIWRTDTFGELHDVAVMGSRLIIGGHFSWVAPSTASSWVCTKSGNGCIARSKLAALDLNGILDQAWDPRMTGAYQGVWRVLVNGPQLWAGGEFTRVSGVAQQRIALFTDPLLG